MGRGPQAGWTALFHQLRRRASMPDAGLANQVLRPCDVTHANAWGRAWKPCRQNNHLVFGGRPEASR